MYKIFQIFGTASIVSEKEIMMPFSGLKKVPMTNVFGSVYPLLTSCGYLKENSFTMHCGSIYIFSDDHFSLIVFKILNTTIL